MNGFINNYIQNSGLIFVPIKAFFIGSYYFYHPAESPHMTRASESTKKWPGFSRKVDKYLSL